MDEEEEMEPAPRDRLLDIYATDIDNDPDWDFGDLLTGNKDFPYRAS